jgi:hypothetical protein
MAQGAGHGHAAAPVGEVVAVGTLQHVDRRQRDTAPSARARSAPSGCAGAWTRAGSRGAAFSGVRCWSEYVASGGRSTSPRAGREARPRRGRSRAPDRPSRRLPLRLGAGERRARCCDQTFGNPSADRSAGNPARAVFGRGAWVLPLPARSCRAALFGPLGRPAASAPEGTAPPGAVPGGGRR